MLNTENQNLESSQGTSENSEKQIKKVCRDLILLLKSIDGVKPQLIEEVKEKVQECLETRKKNGQGIASEYKSQNVLHDEYEMPDEIEQYCNKFKERIEGISDVDIMIDTLKELLKHGNLIVNNNNTGKKIMLNVLDYDIKILNLGSYNKKKYNITTKNNIINPASNHPETDENGMLKISSHCSEGRKVATQTDIQNILKTLTSHYGVKAGINGDIHDEDIAFFMLMTQSDGEFLLKKDKVSGKNRVLKCYEKFRGFKDMLESGTGQVILVKKKQ